MPFTISWSQIKSFIREAASIAGLVVSIGNQLHLPAGPRAVLLGVSGWLQVVEHQVYKVAAANVPTTSTTVTLPTTPSTTVTTTQSGPTS